MSIQYSNTINFWIVLVVKKKIFLINFPATSRSNSKLKIRMLLTMKINVIFRNGTINSHV